MILKRLVGFSIFLFTVFIFIIFIGFIVGPKNNNTIPTKITFPSGVSSITLSQSEIAKHNRSSDCWLIINNKVYDVSSVIFNHPGGSQTIVSHCGQQSTSAWNTKDTIPGRLHSAMAQALLQNYLLGNFNATITQSNLQTVQSQSASTSEQLRGREREDD